MEYQFEKLKIWQMSMDKDCEMSGFMDASELHRDCRQLAGRRYLPSSRTISGNDGPLAPPTVTQFLGSFSHEETGDEDSWQRVSSSYRFFSGYGSATFGSSPERFGTRIFSRLDCAQKRLYRSLSHDMPPAFILLGPLFKRLPSAGPKIGLGRVDNGACFKKENKISGFSELLDA